MGGGLRALRLRCCLATTVIIALVAFLFVGPVLAQTGDTLYRNDLEKAAVGQTPEEFLVINGGFVVGEASGNKFLELPGSPLDSYSALFGPTQKEGVTASARVFGAAKGRRGPSFGVGLNGVSGYRIQVSPGKQALELFRGDIARASVPFTWTSGKWTHLRIQASKTGAAWKIVGKAWPEGQAEPADWTISVDDTEDLPAGRASIHGSPYAGTPIRFDDLEVARAKK